MEDFSHHADFPDEISRPYSPHDETLDFPHPDEGADDETQLTQDCGYNSSASSTHPSSGDILDADYDDDELPGLKSRASSRSSVSSLPGSVFTHSMEGAKTIARDAQESVIFWDDRYNKGQARAEPGLKSLQALRQRESAFRKPSSVRALQMHTEDEGDEEYLTPPRRRGGHRMSDISMRSSHSSPLKRSPYYSPSGSASKQKVKKEYPLVLLHCTLLPPSLPIPGLLGPPDPKVLKEVLPSEYWRRWKLLEEKVGSGVLRDRGVLISHPEDMYDLLEDRLLESLELQHPRLDHGHFVGHEEGDSEREDQASKEESETDGEQGEDCPDCGGRFLKNNHSRKWEIKVFAANGLMRAGAWAAAWKEMEKVDVEVGLWLPSELRRELEKRLRDSEMSTALTRIEVPQLVEPMNEPEIQPSLPQPSPSLSTVMPVLFTPERASSPIPPPSPTPAPRQQHRPTPTHNPIYPPKPEVEIDLHTLLVNYIRVLANDRRNVAIVLLSILVVFFAIDYRPRAAAPDLHVFPQEDALSSTSVPSMHISPAQSSSAVWATPVKSNTQVPIAPTSSVVASSSASYQSSSASVVSSATSVAVAQTEEPADVEVKQSEETKHSPEIKNMKSAAIDSSMSQHLPPQDDKILVDIENENPKDADTNDEAPAPIVAPAEKQIDFKLDEPVEPSLEIPDTTLNDTPRESLIEVQKKTREHDPSEVHENEIPLIKTQTAMKEQQALIATT
ncbi:uncharacterized protein LDX57_011810 [Aspergillus melleus]|uniref:uncharacterized protein n=1 Tax=Aspergillus melleus TaxID=138277 RepID=UPI001E8DCEA3|nr:uncharacterized protein LDX57_011810 [Aspergillus melleus]KAH8434172.1 hypothetical protein LDX57_011810 [Aspergillus melleus]